MTDWIRLSVPVLIKNPSGFNADIADPTEQNIGELFKQALPQDFVKFGLIPEFIGRVPVTVALDLLDEEALKEILTRPKNAITKQYQKTAFAGRREIGF